MDIALCAFDPKSSSLSFAGAMEPLYILRKEEERIEEIKGDRQAIGGIMEEGDQAKSFKTHQLQMNKGDRFYIFSDGFPDQFGGEKGKKLKYKAFRNILLEKRGTIGMADHGEYLEQRFEEWRGDIEQVDDVLVIGAEV